MKNELIQNISWNEFFIDQTFNTSPGEDSMRPPREFLDAATQQKVMDSYLTNGECTALSGVRPFPYSPEFRPMQTCDGQPLFSQCHTRSWTNAMTFSNMLSGVATLSMANVISALRLSQNNGIYTPDTLIVGPHAAMTQKANDLQEELFDIHRWKIDVCVSASLKEQFGCRWFLASRKNSGMHFHDCGQGYVEICAMRWDWIVSSLATYLPVNR